MRVRSRVLPCSGCPVKALNHSRLILHRAVATTHRKISAPWLFHDARSAEKLAPAFCRKIVGTLPPRDRHVDGRIGGVPVLRRCNRKRQPRLSHSSSSRRSRTYFSHGPCRT